MCVFGGAYFMDRDELNSTQRPSFSPPYTHTVQTTFFVISTRSDQSKLQLNVS